MASLACSSKQEIHDFIVVKNLNRNIILGVRMYFDLGALRIGEEYVALEEGIHISSTIRLV